MTKGYRDLPREEPPRELDEAILAASRRAVDSRPAPLVVPAGRRRWYFPVAAAAIIVLAVAVTVQVEREGPSEEILAARVEPAQEVLREEVPVEKAKPAPQAASKAERAPERRHQYTPDPKPAPASPQPESRDLQDQRSSAAAEAPRERMDALAKRADEAKAKGAPSAPARAATAPLRQERIIAAREQEGIPGSMGPLSTLAHATPEQRLQGIADLRRQGRHEDADKALAEFRRAYPQYRISEEMRAKVEREPARAR
jgi:outer membrane biosynthesis protein TonB